MNHNAFEPDLEKYKQEKRNIIQQMKESLEVFIEEFYSFIDLHEGNHNTDTESILCNVTEINPKYQIQRIPIHEFNVGIDSLKDSDDMDITEQEELEEEEIYIHGDRYFLSLMFSIFVDSTVIPNYEIILSANICSDRTAVFLTEAMNDKLEDIIVTEEDALKLFIQIFVALDYLKESLDLNHNNLCIKKIQFVKKSFILTLDESEIESDFIAKITDFSEAIFSVKLTIDENTQYQEKKNITFYPSPIDETDINEVNIHFEDNGPDSTFTLRDVSFEDYEQLICTFTRMPPSLDYYSFVVSALSNKHIYSLISENQDILDLVKDMFGSNDITLEELSKVTDVYEYLRSKDALFVNVSDAIDTFINVLSEVESD